MTENQRRQFLKLVGTSLAAAGAGFLPGISRGEKADATEIRNPTRKVLAERLKKLAKSETPKELLHFGWVCYLPAMPPLREEKTCPDCERKMKVGEMEEILGDYNVPLKRIQDQELDAKLIFPEYCPTCGYGLEKCGWSLNLSPEERDDIFKKRDGDKPGDLSERISAILKPRKLHLELTYPDHPDPIRVELDEANDLELMALFLQGKDRYKLPNDMENPLKWEVERLRELFGVVEK